MSFDVKEILALPNSEKKLIADLIYESLDTGENENSVYEPIPIWQKQMLNERLKSIEDGTAKFLSKDDFDKQIKQMMDEKRNRVS